MKECFCMTPGEVAAESIWIIGAYSRYLYERMGFALIFKLPFHLGLSYWLFRKDLA